MCGISGYYLTDRTEESADKILRMLRSVAHRGPDDEGIMLLLPERSFALDLITSDTARGVKYKKSVDDAGRIPHRIAFGHRRFSIIDLSPAGHQPFWSHNREVCVCSNSEIYNYIELREELKALGHVFHTNSDTEVLVEAYLEWGVDCFKRFNGFWALSLYDSRKKAVLLARDRIGKAPLYVARTHEGLWWASEIKGIFAALGSSTFRIREQAVSDYIFHMWRDVFHKTFYEGIVTFPNASYAWIEPDGSYEPKTYWALPPNRLREKDITPDEAVGRLRNLLTDAVRLRLRADVPIVHGLSGGLDSSSLVALTAGMKTAVDAFTVSSRSTDEEFYAAKVAERYPGLINLTVLEPPSDELLNQADSFFYLEEEPFNSPNLMASQGIYRMLSEQGIRVVFDGAGVDGNFAGDVHSHSPYLRHLLKRGRLLRFVKEFFLFSEARRTPGAFLHRSRQLLQEPLHSPVLPSIDPFVKPLNVETLRGPSRDIHQRLIDIIGDWEMNYWFRSGEKASMGTPIEDRSPFLDYRVVDFAFTLPLGYLIRDGWLKWILRETVKDILPAEVVWRKRKVGGIPFNLPGWLAASEQRFFEMTGNLECPYIDFKKLRSAYSELIRHDPRYLWRIMCLALWWKRCIQGDSLV